MVFGIAGNRTAGKHFWCTRYFLHLMCVAVACLGAKTCLPQSVNDNSGASPRAADPTGLSYYAHAHPYLEEPVKRLIKHIPELGTIRPIDDREAREFLPIILMHTSMRVGEFFDDAVDVMAQEDVAQEILAREGAPIASQRVRYSYLILLNRSENPPRYEEYRTDGEGNRAEQQGVEHGFAITTGFALKCIYFSAALVGDSRFRYLGDEMLGGNDTYVVAFAQVPEHTSFWGTATGEWGTVRILDQGIAWIDKQTFQILRIRTDLLAAHSEIGLARQTTVVTFGAVQIPDVSKALWLPSEARVDADFQGQWFRNEHHYSDYQRFRVSVKMGPPKQ